MVRKSRSFLLPVICVAVALGVTSRARADFSLALDTTINGTSPTGDLKAMFQTVTAGTSTTVGEVKLTLDTTDLSSAEFVGSWGFNVISSYTNTLTIARYAGAAGGTAPAGTISSIVNSPNGTALGNQVKAGLFDIGFFFVTSGGAGGNRFSGGNTVVIKLTGLNLTADVFNAVSANKTTNPTSTGGWISAADVQGIPSAGGTISGSVGTKSTLAVPEPASLAMMGLGIPSAMAFLRRRKKA